LPITGAKMQQSNWNDLRYLLAVARGQTLARAARLVGVDDTTVARRLAALQQRLGVPLYQRTAEGALTLTRAGEQAVLRAERIEREIGAIGAQLTGAEGAAAGTVRVTAVPILANRILIPASAALLTRHPGLRLDIIGEARDLSLTRREADLALRLARPRTGGTRVLARRVGALHYAAYAPAACPPREAERLPWITYDEAMAHLPQARWIAARAADRGEAIAALRVADAEAVLEAVIAGLGRSLLPAAIAEGETRLQRIGSGRSAPALSRELWLLMHRELKSLTRIEAVIDWIEATAPR
jgi:DNA-binding transcriptional LysR family regulator